MKKSDWVKHVKAIYSKVYADDDTMHYFLALLGRGYLPRQLPPPFQSKSFASAVRVNPREFRDTISDHLFKKQAQACGYSVARPGQLRRRLGIPNPAFHYLVSLKVAELFKGFRHDFETAENDYSLSFPVFQADERNRAFEFATDWDAMPHVRLKARAKGKYIVKADIARFFPSIYTHSIPWALHGKATAKANKNDLSLDGNVLDLLVRNAQDGQTLGLPIGPDTSFIISEKLLLQIDSALAGLIGDRTMNCFHRVDDYEFACITREDADICLAKLQEALQEFELELNTLKTEIQDLPQDLQDSEVSQLRRFELGEIANRARLLEYFDLAFSGYRRYPKGTLKYAIKRIPTQSYFDESIADFMLQCMLLEPGATEAAFIWLTKAECLDRIDQDRFATCLSRIIVEHSALGHSSEVAWAIWGLLLLEKKIPRDVVRAIASMNDSAVLLLALDARSKGLLSGRSLSTKVKTHMNAPELYGSQWLLSYEAVQHEWVRKAQRGHVTADPVFALFADSDTVFYEAHEVETYQEIMRDWEPYNPYKPDEEEDGDEDLDWE